MEQTFIMIKPDGIKRSLVGEIISRFEKKGFRIVEASLMQVSREKAMVHYQEHSEKYFFDELVDFITSGPIFAMVLEGKHVVDVTRLMVGDKDPLKRLPGTIRGDYSTTLSHNIIHASDSLESAEREIKLFFKET